MSSSAGVKISALQITRLRAFISKLSFRKTFVHNKWFIKYHLQIVEKIANELCEVYPAADRSLVIALVWFHDYGKLMDFKHEHTFTQKKGLAELIRLGFAPALAKKILDYIKVIDAKKNLRRAPIEIKIVSSADGAAHLVGPFFTLYWYEHPTEGIQSLIAKNERKLTVDWTKKIVLPEVKKAFQSRYFFLKEQLAKLPTTFL